LLRRFWVVKDLLDSQWEWDHEPGRVFMDDYSNLLLASVAGVVVTEDPSTAAIQFPNFFLYRDASCNNELNGHIEYILPEVQAIVYPMLCL